MSGYLLFVDCTRRATLAGADALRRRVAAMIPSAPFVLVLSKMDLERDWQLGPTDLTTLSASAEATLKTSAKTGDGIALLPSRRWRRRC